MKLRVESQKPVKLNLTDTQTNASISHSTTIQPLPVIQIGTVETLPEGADATASFSGDPRTPSLNLGIPVGATGAQGRQGIQGERGPQGERGERGATGETGPAGHDGVAAGFGTPEATVTGLSYDATPTVSVTASGSDTSKVFAFSFGIPAGEPGQQGPAGSTGPQGPQGPAGADYVLTAADKTEIANIVLGELPIYNGGVS